jgi:hypothetical protein
VNYITKCNDKSKKWEKFGNCLLLFLFLCSFLEFVNEAKNGIFQLFNNRANIYQMRFIAFKNQCNAQV